jgi:formylglycine-generating enzyme required for sulfatase activity
LKPSNCLISSDFELKISDFGLSKDLNQNVDSSHSRNAYAIGTPAYMSPESIDGKIGYYSDVWAFGMIAFELFSGDLPWGRDINPLVLIGNIQHKEIDVRKKLISLKLPTKLIDIIEQCLRREISKRYRDGMALKKDFYHWAKEERKRIRYSRFKKSWYILIEKELLETFVVYQVENGISNFRLDDFLNFSEVMILPEALDLEKLGDVLDILSQVSREIQLEDALGKQLSDEKIAVMINRLKLVIKEELKSFGKKGWERQGFWIRNVIIGGTILSSIIGGLWYRNETIKETIKEKKLLAMEEERRQKEAVIQKVKDDLQLILMTGGSFMMGHEKGNRDEKPMHLVHVKDFYMSKTEVTVGQYQQCVDAGICSKPHWDEGSCQIWNQSKWRKGILEKEFKEDNQPIVCVDWYQARVFAKWVGGDLPSEAQWEYASRSGGQDLKYPWGNQEPTCDLANFNYNCRKATSPVCSHPNGNTTQGLCDMGGNVWEWVLDEYHASYQDAPSEDLGWCSDQACESNSSTPRVHRGGAWYLNASYLRSTLRYRNVPNLHFNVLGFRVAFDLSLNPNR